MTNLLRPTSAQKRGILKKRPSRRAQYLEAVSVLKAKGIIPPDELPASPAKGSREHDEGPDDRDVS